MGRIERYHLGLNWSTSRETAFTQAIADEARRRGVRWFFVPKSAAKKTRRRVSDGRLKVGVFLNTQADGVNMESTHMLLCRSLKASGCLVIEDPDDAPVYANRARQLDYLEKAGLPVPRRLAISRWEPGKRVLTPTEQGKIGASWFAQPSVGLGRRLSLAGTGKLTSRLLLRNRFRPKGAVLIYTHLQPEHDTLTRFRVWYFFGQVVIRPANTHVNLGSTQQVCIAARHEARLTALAHRISQITGLDWFATEVTITKRNGNKRLRIWEPANTLAFFGPGVKPLAELPMEVAQIGAERLVEVAWRRARGLPLTDGLTLRK